MLLDSSVRQKQQPNHYRYGRISSSNESHFRISKIDSFTFWTFDSNLNDKLNAK